MSTFFNLVALIYAAIGCGVFGYVYGFNDALYSVRSPYQIMWYIVTGLLWPVAVALILIADSDWIQPPRYHQ